MNTEAMKFCINYKCISHIDNGPCSHSYYANCSEYNTADNNGEDKMRNCPVYIPGEVKPAPDKPDDNAELLELLDRYYFKGIGTLKGAKALTALLKAIISRLPRTGKELIFSGEKSTEMWNEINNA